MGISLLTERAHAVLVGLHVLGDCAPYLEVEGTGAVAAGLVLQLRLQVGIDFLVFRREFLELGGLHVLLYLGEGIFRHVFEHVADTLEGGTPVYVQGKVLGIGLTDGSVTLLFELADLPPLLLSRAVAPVHLAYLLGVFLGDGVFLLLKRAILAQIVHHGLKFVLQGFLVDFLQPLALCFLCQP